MNTLCQIRFSLLLVILALTSTASVDLVAEDDALAWPELQSQHRPWAYNWWMGSATDKKNITSQLEAFHKAGIGGMHIIPSPGLIGAISGA